MGLKLITPPTVTPISVVGLAALKEHLREAPDITDEDDSITSYLSTAWELAEAHTWRQFLTAEWKYTLSSWIAQHPDQSHGRYLSRVLIPRPPTRSIDSVKYIDTGGTLTTLTVDDDYIVDDSGDIWTIEPAYNKCWPTTRRHPHAVQITFTAGYGETLADLPAVLLHALRLQVATWFMHRESVDTRQHHELPEATKALLESIEVRDDRLITDE